MPNDIMSSDNFQPEPNVAYIGEGVVINGTINVPSVLVVEGTVEGEVTARSIRIGTSGSVKGKLVVSEADVYGSLSENTEVEQFLLVRATGRIEGNVTCGEIQVEKGGRLAGSVFSAHPSMAKESIAKIEPVSPAKARPTLAAAE